MSDLKPLEIAHNFCKILVQEKTGNRQEFGSKFGIASCRVTSYKKKIESIYEIRIDFNHKRKTYFISAGDKEKLPKF